LGKRPEMPIVVWVTEDEPENASCSFVLRRRIPARLPSTVHRPPSADRRPHESPARYVDTSTRRCVDLPTRVSARGCPSRPVFYLNFLLEKLTHSVVMIGKIAFKQKPGSWDQASLCVVVVATAASHASLPVRPSVRPSPILPHTTSFTRTSGMTPSLPFASCSPCCSASGAV